MAITEIEDYVGQAKARLPHQHRGKTELEALLTYLIEPAQSIESAFWQLLSERGVDVATDEQLNILGRVVGQSRGGLEDDDYRRYIRARIATNRSNGTTEDLIRITQLVVYDDLLLVEVSNIGIATVVVRVRGMGVSEELGESLLSFLQSAVSAGVRLLVEYLPLADEDDTFTTREAPVYTLLDGAVSPAATTIQVDSTTSFGTSGSIVLSPGLAAEETVTYTGKTNTTFTGVSGVANSHLDNALVYQYPVGETLMGKGFGDIDYSRTTITDGATSVGATTINVGFTDGFPASGTVEVSPGTVNAETFVYTSKTGTSFTGATGVANAHPDGATVQQVDAAELGGRLAGALE